jgi:hypothetical protein
MDKVTKNSTPRKQVAISALSPVGCKARVRAILEGERRFCGDKTEVILGSQVTMFKMERLSMLLDLRTARGAHVKKSVYTEAKKDMKETYIEFGIQCHKYDVVVAAKAKEKEFSSSSKPPPKPSSVAQRQSVAKGFAYVARCVHHSDNGSGSYSSDEKDSMETDTLAAITQDLEKDFAKAWKNRKTKMQTAQWDKVIFQLMLLMLLLLYLSNYC